MVKSYLSEFFYQLHDGSLNGRVIIHATGSYQKLLLSNCWVMQKYLQAASVAQKDLLLLWLRLSQIQNVGLHFENRSWIKEGEVEECVVWREVDQVWGLMDQVWREGMSVKGSLMRANSFRLIGSLPYPWCYHSCLACRIYELNISWVKSVEWYYIRSININDHILILFSVKRQIPFINFSK